MCVYVCVCMCVCVCVCVFGDSFDPHEEPPQYVQLTLHRYAYEGPPTPFMRSTFTWPVMTLYHRSSPGVVKRFTITENTMFGNDILSIVGPMILVGDMTENLNLLLIPTVPSIVGRLSSHKHVPIYQFVQPVHVGWDTSRVESMYRCFLIWC